MLPLRNSVMGQDKPCKIFYIFFARHSMFFLCILFSFTFEMNVQNHHELTLENVREYDPESYLRSACKTSMLET